jgi:signal transduction histidine kinase
VDGVTTEHARLIAIGEIAAEIAHELRNALQVVATSAYLAKLSPATSAPHLAKIERHTRIAQEIVDDLMSLARGEPAKAEPSLLADILVHARASLDDMEEVEQRVHYTDELTPSSLRVRAHPGLLARVFAVLYDNSVAICAPRAAQIVTHASVGETGTVIIVSDDGPGVPNEIAAKIFDPLVTGREGGTGLGLALAKRIMQAHGGTISLVPSDRGASFRIVLPA